MLQKKKVVVALGHTALGTTIPEQKEAVNKAVVAVADLISADRTYRDVDRFRKMAQNDLDKAMLCAFEWAIESVLKKETPLPVTTVEAYNFYLKKIADRTDTKSKSAEHKK